MKELYKLAALLNQFSDIDEVSELTGIPEELIEKAVEEIKSGKELTRSEKDNIQQLYNSFYRSKTLARKELNENTNLAEALQYVVEKGITDDPNVDLLESFVDDFVEQKISPELLYTAESAFSDLSASQQYRLSEWLKESPENKTGAWLELWANDTDYGSQPMEDIDASEFWAWFRETFYNE